MKSSIMAKGDERKLHQSAAARMNCVKVHSSILVSRQPLTKGKAGILMIKVRKYRKKMMATKDTARKRHLSLLIWAAAFGLASNPATSG